MESVQTETYVHTPSCGRGRGRSRGHSHSRPTPNTTRRYPKALRAPLRREDRLAGARCRVVAQAGREGPPKGRLRCGGAHRLPHPNHSWLARRALVRGGQTAPAVDVRLVGQSRVCCARHGGRQHVPSARHVGVDERRHRLRRPRRILEVCSWRYYLYIIPFLRGFLFLFLFLFRRGQHYPVRRYRRVPHSNLGSDNWRDLHDRALRSFPTHHAPPLTLACCRC